MEDMHITDRGIELDDFARAVSEGLSREQKELPCRFLYDARGSDLFEDITVLDEYYPTRTEAAILEQCSPEIAADTPASAMLVEFGSGSSVKTEILLAALDKLGVYVGRDDTVFIVHVHVERFTPTDDKVTHGLHEHRELPHGVQDDVPYRIRHERVDHFRELFV